ncbi:MAG TPA: 3-hydroxylacyl-ACP dehydratase [Gammaproteobacteria bacterium]|nr:3-hydroxylacyl-ACP dehydratase [Gammaproteobacteria bacterium]
MDMHHDIADVLPHKGPAVLIDRVIEDSRDSIRVSAHIDRTHRFFVAGHGVPSWVGIEMMAQAIAAHAGINGRRENREPRTGMLLGTRRYETTTPWFPEGANLEILAEREFGEDGGLAACQCTILCDGQTLASATIIIIEINDEMKAQQEQMR